MGIENFQASGASILCNISNNSKEGYAGVTPGHTKFYVTKKPVPGAPKLYVLKNSKIGWVFC